MGLVSGYRQSREAMRLARIGPIVFSGTMVLANIVMVIALLIPDFSVAYVAQVGSHASPTWVRIVSLWSSLEGSILFWGAILGGYVTVFTYQMTDRYREYVPYATGILMGVCTFFAFLIAGPAESIWRCEPSTCRRTGTKSAFAKPYPHGGSPPASLFGLRWHDRSLRHCRGCSFARQAFDGVAQAASPVDDVSVGLFDGRYHCRRLVGLRSFGLGRLLGVGPVENASFLPWLPLPVICIPRSFRTPENA